MKAAATTGELLLHWLSHTGEGSWPGFVAALASIETVSDLETPSRLRIRLSELSHVEFFVGGSRRWRTLAPLLGGLRDPDAAILVGGRTPRLVGDLCRAADDVGCRSEVSSVAPGPGRVVVSGSPDSMAAAANAVGLAFIPDLAGALAATVESVASAVVSGIPAAAPVNWSVRSFDLSEFRWVDGFIPGTAYEYRSRYGQLQHYVRGPGRVLVRLDRRHAVYGAAWLNRTPLLLYSKSDEELSVPRWAPMPEPMARAAAACAGTSAELRDDRFVYRRVPPAIAGALMLEAGQRPPEPNWLNKERSLS